MAKELNRPKEDETRPMQRSFEPLHPPEQATHLLPALGERSPTADADIERRQLELLFRLSCDGLVLHEVGSETVRGNFLQANEAICRLLSYSLEEMRQLTPSGIVAPEELGRIPGDKAAMERDGVLVHQKTLLANDGRRIPVEINSRLFEHDGKQMVVSTIRDITERRKVEESLRQSEERLRLAMQGAQMGRWEWNLRTQEHYWSERVYELLGLEPLRKASTKTLLERVHPADKEAVTKLADQVIAGEMDFRTEFRIIRGTGGPGGEIRWLSSQGMLVRDNDGRPVRVLGMLYDVTPRKQVEEQLRQLNERLETEVEAQTEELRESIGRLQDEVAGRVMAQAKLRKQSRMLEGFFRHTITPLAFLDSRFRYVQVNEAYARMSDKAPESFAGKDYFALHPEPEAREIFEQVTRNRRPYSAHARPHVDPDDPERRVTYWDWQLTPLLSERGQVQFLVLNLEDVTKEQAGLRELEHRARQLQKLTLELSHAEDDERKRLADILHDDLQQVLAAAKFHVGLLDNQATDAQAVKEIAGQVRQMLKEAIDKSRSLSHELSPVFYQVDLADVFAWLARQMQSRHGLTVNVQVCGRADSPSEVMKAFLYKAAYELLFNVTKHAGVSEATLRLRRMRRQLWLTISDQGQGFDTKALAKTSGFGLLTIRERVELLGGRMRIKSTRGRGSTFLIAIPDPAAPVVDGEPKPAAEASPAEYDL
jgi:PAS domain S-box-containing protein